MVKRIVLVDDAGVLYHFFISWSSFFSFLTQSASHHHHQHRMAINNLNYKVIGMASLQECSRPQRQRLVVVDDDANYNTAKLKLLHHFRQATPETWPSRFTSKQTKTPSKKPTNQPASQQAMDSVSATGCSGFCYLIPISQN